VSALQPGQLVGRYRIEGKIGSGGHAEVYRARREDDGRPVAIKTVQIADRDAVDLGDRLLYEADALAQIDHPNVVMFYEAGIQNTTVWMAVELVEGECLRDVMERHGKLPLETSLRWIRDLADGISEAHRVSILHRDIKPENVMITSTQQPKILDFGIAKYRGRLKTTAHGQTVGTPLYMAPEQVKAHQPSPQWDVYALGLVLYEMLNGGHPLGEIHDREMREVMQWQLHGTITPLHELHPDIPRDVSDLVAWATRRDPKNRAGSMRELADKIRDVLRAHLSRVRGDASHVTLENFGGASPSNRPPPVVTDPPSAGPQPMAVPTPEPRPRKKKELSLLLLMALIVGGVAGIGFLLFSLIRRVPESDSRPVNAATSPVVAPPPVTAAPTPTVTATAQATTSAAVPPPKVTSAPVTSSPVKTSASVAKTAAPTSAPAAPPTLVPAVPPPPPADPGSDLIYNKK
jgi:serine/threonine-protein kinase